MKFVYSRFCMLLSCLSKAWVSEGAEGYRPLGKLFVAIAAPSGGRTVARSELGGTEGYRPLIGLRDDRSTSLEERAGVGSE
jgi:hypothetical protein